MLFANFIDNGTAASTAKNARIAAVRRAYGQPTDFLVTFAPSQQARFSMHPLRCYTGKAPTLTDLSAAYGRATACRWLAEQLRDLFAFCSVKTVPDSIVKALTDTLLSVYGQLRVTELMLFFMYFKGGHYGHFYGLPDPVIVTDGLCRFARERRQTIAKLSDEQAKNDTAAQPPVPAEPTCTWEEYMAIRRRAEAGDTEAQQLLLPPWERTQ